MGFWDVTKRVLQGKPGFEAPENDDSWDDDNPTTDFAEERQAKRDESSGSDGTHGLVDEKGYKHPPLVTLTNVKSDFNGKNLELWVTIKNTSDRDVFLDKITLLGATTRFSYPLAAGAQRVFRSYNGPKPVHDHYKRTELYYKDAETGDYFRVDHLIQYQYETDGTYDVVDFECIEPVYDI